MAAKGKKAMFVGVTLVAQWRPSEVGFAGEVGVLQCFPGRPAGGPVPCNGAKAR